MGGTCDLIDDFVIAVVDRLVTIATFRKSTDVSDASIPGGFLFIPEKPAFCLSCYGL
jgi:hypothetical protein